MAQNKNEKTFTLLVPDYDNKPEAAIRIFDGSKQVFYTSTRLGGVKRVDDGYQVELDKEFIGKKYVLKKIMLKPGKDKKNLLKGTVEIDMPEAVKKNLKG